MATAEDCRAALEGLSRRLAANAERAGQKLTLDRTLACTITDLGIAFHGRLANSKIIDLDNGDDPTAKIRLTTTSNDLIAIVNGSLSVTSAWSQGIIKIQANVLDLVKLRRLL
jgi:SCP-2 sterol transfer family